jgi:hypothetical protein
MFPLPLMVKINLNVYNDGYILPTNREYYAANELPSY